MLLHSAPTFLLSLSSLDIQFVDMNPAISCTHIADCWLRNEYLARLIVSQLEQVVTQWNAVLFQLFNGWTIYSLVCLFLYIKLRWN